MARPNETPATNPLRSMNSDSSTPDTNNPLGANYRSMTAPSMPQPRVVEVPTSATAPRRPEMGMSDSKNRLVVGVGIALKGAAITACDSLVVEGNVEAILKESRQIEISASGQFKGDAEIDIADISGRFEGNLTAKQKLVIRSGGSVTGTIRYAQLEVESGGEISGDIQVTGKPNMMKKAV